MARTVLHGLGASPGVAVGRAIVVREVEASGAPPDQAVALAALEQAAAELGRAAAGLRNAGLADEAEILEANRLMAEDPSLAASVRELAARLAPAEALREAAEGFAGVLAALPDPVLAGRASDVRELGRRAARIADGSAAQPLAEADSILLARDLGPAEIAELELGEGRIVAVALIEGSATAHAAIVARSLGLPMAVAFGTDLAAIAEGTVLVLDGEQGVVSVDPGHVELEEAQETLRQGSRRRRALAGLRGLPTETLDGRRIVLLCNAASLPEIDAGLAAGAAGVGLLRTELAFLEAPAWPTEQQHRAVLEPLLAALRGRVATVRTLDFGGDKTPPFLDRTPERGLALTLAEPDALAAQLRAISQAGADARLRILLPLVESGQQVRAVRSLLQDSLGEEQPFELGAMIETPEGVRRATEIALEAQFLSIGTNDLVSSTLGLHRDLPLASAETAADPAVLAHVVSVVAAAHESGITVEVCGEAAGVPELVVLFVGLGVDELSVAPARVDLVRGVVRALSAERSGALARDALAAPSAAAALELVRSGEAGDELREALEGLGGVRARG
ncbi:MAG: multiphosphoryl transfer protein [Gaiellaceae bacterium]|jgi:phosphoenolpyruvate-protein kinase (PTS system EI component)|nr:multiphosphoryl transfer protein [Gaiellaceae bacterium]